MTNQELQEAIDKTRAWLSSPQFPSLKARDDAVAAVAELQKIQVTRAAMVSAPTLTVRPGSFTEMPTDGDYLAALGPCGK
jgi:hypothetical protein